MPMYIYFCIYWKSVIYIVTEMYMHTWKVLLVGEFRCAVCKFVFISVTRMENLRSKNQDRRMMEGLRATSRVEVVAHTDSITI